AAAFAAMVKAGVTQAQLFALATALDARGRHELAFNLSTSLPAVNGEGMSRVVNAYGMLVAWKGEAAADAWIKGVVPEAHRGFAATLAFGDGFDGLVWSLVPASLPDNDTGEFQWLMRAASSVRSDPKGSPHEAIVRDHYKETHASHYTPIGQFL